MKLNRRNFVGALLALPFINKLGLVSEAEPALDPNLRRVDIFRIYTDCNGNLLGNGWLLNRAFGEIRKGDHIVIRSPSPDTANLTCWKVDEDPVWVTTQDGLPVEGRWSTVVEPWKPREDLDCFIKLLDRPTKKYLTRPHRLCMVQS